MNVARNRRGRKSAEQIVRAMIDPMPAAPLTPTPERRAAFEAKWSPEGRPLTWSQVPENLTLPKVTRVEIIDAGGRDVTRHYKQAGITISVQDEGRTIKIFAGELDHGSTHAR